MWLRASYPCAQQVTTKRKQKPRPVINNYEQDLDPIEHSPTSCFNICGRSLVWWKNCTHLFLCTSLIQGRLGSWYIRVGCSTSTRTTIYIQNQPSNHKARVSSSCWWWHRALGRKLLPHPLWEMLLHWWPRKPRWLWPSAMTIASSWRMCWARRILPPW